jgi:ABC-2 type transport system permease protein
MKKIGGFFSAVGSVAYKEFLHIERDWRILVLILLLPPLLTFIFGHAFEGSSLNHMPGVLRDEDQSDKSRKFVELISKKDTFNWRIQKPDTTKEPDLLREGVQGALIIPQGWSKSLSNGSPAPIQLVLDGTDTITAEQIEGAVKQVLGEFQLLARNEMIESLPEEVIEMGEKLPVEIRKQFVSSMEPWSVTSKILYNPRKSFIFFVTPGIIGLILQLLTVTLMACTITRERESGTLSQLMVTSLRRREIVIGKVLPYLGISLFLIASSICVTRFYFGVEFRQPLVLGLICLLFLACSLGLGLLISAFCDTQAQAIQLAVFYLLPVFPLSGAFAPIEQLPEKIRYLSELFPLTHFCHAFLMINLRNADLSYIMGDLVFLFVGAILTSAGAAFFLQHTND